MEKIIEISSGRGPKECCLAVQHVFQKIQKEADVLDLKIIINEKVVQDPFPSSVEFKIVGKNGPQLISRWLGVILWICRSPFRPNHPRKNWFVEVLELNPLEENVDIFEKDVQFQTMRSSGAGGQHVNKVSSAVRATHLPSGHSVQVMDSRSQLQNKQIALKRLRDMLESDNKQGEALYNRERWNDQVNIDRGNPVLVFEGDKFKEKK
jgi:peptide chain release factor